MSENLPTPEEFALSKGIVNEDTIVLAMSQLEECYFKIIETLKDYIETTDENFTIVATWIIATYFHESFNTFPYLFFNAMRGSAKTRMLKLISALSAGGDGSVQNNLTEAVLFRIPRGTTTCIDEVEQINSKDKQTLRELLNSAYKKGTKVKRMRKSFSKEGEQQVTETFQPYFPIAMANINGIEEVLSDRSIVLNLEKSNNPRVVMKIEDFDRNDTILEIKRTLSRISVVCVVSLQKKDYIAKWNDYIRKRYNDITTLYTLTTQTTQTTPFNMQLEYEEFFNKLHDLGIFGRNFELFFPLIVISMFSCSKVIFENFTQVVHNYVENKKEEEFMDSKDVSVYQFVAEHVEENKFHSVKDLVSHFRLFLGEGDDEDRWLNEKWFGRALKRLNLIVDKRRMASGRYVTLNYLKAKEKLKIFKG